MKNFYKKPSCYTTLPNSFAQDNRLSIEARGIGLLIFSLPEDWHFRQTWFYGNSGPSKNRAKTVIPALNELIACGYLARDQSKNSGQFSDSIWFFDPEGNALELLETVITSSNYGTVVTSSVYATSDDASSAPIKEERTKEEFKKEKVTPLTPKRGNEVGHKFSKNKKVPTLADLADQHQMTVGTIEDYIEFRLNSGGIENPVAFEKHVLRNLSERYSEESVHLEEWFQAIGTEHHVIDHLTNEFSSMHWFDRRKCREQAKDDIILKNHNIVPSDVVIEIAYQEAEAKRRERIGGAA